MGTCCVESVETLLHTVLVPISLLSLSLSLSLSSFFVCVFGVVLLEAEEPAYI
jgi:hypothetical protein